MVRAHAFGSQHVVFNNWEDQGQRNAKTLMSILDVNAIAPLNVRGNAPEKRNLPFTPVMTTGL